MSTTTTTTPTTATLSAEAADSRHAEIVKSLRDLLTARRTFVKLLKAAKNDDLHTALGFASWADYAASILATLPKNTSKAEREWLAVVAVHFGVSQRAAAEGAGVSQPTVSRRVKAEGAKVAAEVAEATGVAEDAKPAEVTTAKNGTTQTRSAKRGKGKAPKVAETVAEVAPIQQGKTAELAATLTAIVGELSNRWAEGDESAEVALREARDMLAGLLIAE